MLSDHEWLGIYRTIQLPAPGSRELMRIRRVCHIARSRVITMIGRPIRAAHGEAVGVAVLVGSVRGVMGFAGAPEFEEKGLHPASTISSASSAQVPLQACNRVRDVVGSFPLTRTVCISACITSCPPSIRRARRKTKDRKSTR